MKKIIAILGAGLLAAASASAVFAATYYQGFETDTAGWFDNSNSGYGVVTRVPSGTDSIVSSEGDFHAIMEGDSSSAPFSRFDMYRDEWTGSWTAEVDVYLDPAWQTGTGFDYSVAANGSDNAHQRDYIFHVTKDTSTGELLVAGSNNTNFAPREDLESINHYAVDTAGWYTLQHVFYDDGGVLAVDMNLLDSDGTVLFTETKTNPADVIATEIGGNRYAWFTFINVPDGIAVDAHELTVTVPAPTSKDECKKGGWMNFNNPSFKNQGDCVSFVASGK